jgi:RNA:NAD 2'-phosphotransferase (TPT1/KptA family)
MVSLLRHGNSRRRGEVRPDGAGYVELGVLAHHLRERSSYILHVALFSQSRRTGSWRFEVAEQAETLYIRARGKHSIELAAETETTRAVLR